MKTSVVSTESTTKPRKSANAPMYNTTLMKRFQTQNDLGDVISRPLLWQGPERFDESGTVATIKVLHYEIKVLLALEGKV